MIPTSLLLLAGVGAGRGLTEYRPPIPLGLDLYFPVPEDNPLTQEKVALGERLFFEPALSRDRTLACAGCHVSDRAFSDTLPVAVGIDGRRGKRNAPPLINLVYGRAFLRDGAMQSIEAQMLHPIHNPLEMDLELTELERRLRLDGLYRRAFRNAFGPGPEGEDEAVTAGNVALALASYVRTILAANAPFDRFLAGNRGALSDLEREGFQLFVGKANCSACHLGPILTDGQFHNTGVALRSGDPGRYRITGGNEDLGRFRTPTLREIERTSPYMHDGSMTTLEEVIRFYDRGGEPHPNLSREIRPLRLTAGERDALAAFLGSLSGSVGAGVR
jgi:cytochrome c peroxidase